MAYNVFISHSRRDRALAAKIAEFVRSSGANVIDFSLEPGEEVARHSTERLQQSNEMLVLVTRNSAKNAWLYWQIGQAAALQKQITPVIEDIDPSELPPPLNDVQAVRANSIEQLREGLTNRVSNSPTRS